MSSSLLSQRMALLRDRQFCYYLFACLLMNIASGLTYIAVAWIIVQDHTNIRAVAGLMIAFWLPNAFTGPMMGVLVDRFGAKLILMISLSVRCACLIAITFIPELNKHLIVFYLLFCLNGIFFSANQPAMIAFVRRLVKPNELMYANANIDMAFEIGNILGMGSAGLLLAILSTDAVFFVFATCFFISMLLLLKIKIKDKGHDNNNTVANACAGINTGTETSADKDNTETLDITSKPLHTDSHYDQSNTDTKPVAGLITKLWRDFTAGLHYIGKHHALKLLYTVQLLIIVQVLITPILLAPFAKTVLKLNGTQFGIIEACMSVGMVMGGFIMPILAKRLGLIPLIQALITLTGISLIAFAFNHNPLIADILYFIMGVSLSVWPLIITSAQEMTDYKFQGRVQSCFNSIAAIVILINSGIISLCSHTFPIGAFYGLAASLSLIAIFVLQRYKKTKQNTANGTNAAQVIPS